MQLAERRNAQPLPELKKGFGLRLPPEEDCLLGANYQLARRHASSAPAEHMDVDGRCISALHRLVYVSISYRLLSCIE